ncbi:MAG: hypothetical protein MOGMAGMI_00087 [Candidatus Omnitrophica bacterium]|nr:hypothetical protein [Candidatus Omnitrophota bacterium]
MDRYRMWSLITLLMTALALQGCAQQTQEGASSASPEAAVSPAPEVRVEEAVEQTVAPAAAAVKKPSGSAFAGKKFFNIYTDGSAPDNHYAPSGWMGDYGDLKINTKHMDRPRSGSTSIQIVYNNKASQGQRWAGIYWQNPPNNWGTLPGGYDLTGATKLTFWARGEKGGERIEEFKLGGISGNYADTDVAGIGPVVLTTEWQQFTIDLADKDLTSISGGFCWATNLDVNPDGATFYLDDIRYE